MKNVLLCRHWAERWHPQYLPLACFGSLLKTGVVGVKQQCSLMDISFPCRWLPPNSCSSASGNKLAVECGGPIKCCKKRYGWEPPTEHSPWAENIPVVCDAESFWEGFSLPYPSSHPDLVPRAKTAVWENCFSWGHRNSGWLARNKQSSIGAWKCHRNNKKLIIIHACDILKHIFNLQGCKGKNGRHDTSILLRLLRLRNNKA